MSLSLKKEWHLISLILSAAEELNPDWMNTWMNEMFQTWDVYWLHLAIVLAGSSV